LYSCFWQESFYKQNNLSTIASLHIGETGYISEESLDFIPLKLLEMGCLPGAEVELVQIAPLKDPLYICVNGSHLAIRTETASQIQILKANH
jgi:ferrous iron transport protein A